MNITMYLSLLRNWRNDDYIVKYAVGKGYYRWESLRNAIYSVICGFIVLLMSEMESIFSWLFVLWLFAAFGIVLALMSSKNITYIALFLKEEEDKFNRKNTAEISLEDFILNGAMARAKNDIVSNFRKGVSILFCALVIICSSYLIKGCVGEVDRQRLKSDTFGISKRINPEKLTNDNEAIKKIDTKRDPLNAEKKDLKLKR